MQTVWRSAIRGFPALHQQNKIVKTEEQAVQNPVRRLYDWVLSWAGTRYGAAALFLLAFTEATFFPVPPDVLLIALVLGARPRAYWLAGVCTAGSVLGGMLGFGIGYFFWSSVQSVFFRYLFEPSTFAYVQELYNRNLFMIVISAALSPIPFKVFTVASGVFASGLTTGQWTLFLAKFVVASVVGRSIRFFAVAALLYRYGQPVKDLLERYFDLITVLAVLLLVVGMVVVRLF